MIATTITLNAEALALGGSALLTALGGVASGFAAIVTAFKEGATKGMIG